MAVYLISYDIPESNSADYQPLWDCLEHLGATRVLWSQWIVISTGSSGQLFDMLKALIGPKDGLLVDELHRATINYQNLRLIDPAMHRIMNNARQ
jgi:hypothetical protein